MGIGNVQPGKEEIEGGYNYSFYIFEGLSFRGSRELCQLVVTHNNGSKLRGGERLAGY